MLYNVLTVTKNTKMSFIGSIGHLLSASGLQQILELVYAPNAVVHILRGHVQTIFGKINVIMTLRGGGGGGGSL